MADAAPVTAATAMYHDDRGITAIFPVRSFESGGGAMVDGGAGGEVPENVTGAGLEGSAAMLRTEADDLDPLLRALAERLAAVPGLPVEVTRRHGRMRRLLGDLPYLDRLHHRNDRVVRIVVRVGADRHWVVRNGTTLRCGVDRPSANHGTVSSTQPVHEWTSELMAAITRRNAAEQGAIAALRQLVEGERA